MAVQNKVDPELLRQLSESTERRAKRGRKRMHSKRRGRRKRTEVDGEPTVEAVFVLDQLGPKRSDESEAAGLTMKNIRSVGPPEDVEETVRRLIRRVEEKTGNHVQQLNVFRYLNSFVVAAKPEVIRSLLEQPEIASAAANRQSKRVAAVARYRSS